MHSVEVTQEPSKLLSSVRTRVPALKSSSIFGNRLINDQEQHRNMYVVGSSPTSSIDLNAR